MTHITRLVLDGFKSFGKRTELVFGKQFNSILGPNGSGKSCAYETEVLLADGTITHIGKLVDESLLTARTYCHLDDGVYCANANKTAVLTLNPETMKIEKKYVAAFVKREGEPHLYKVTTSTGKSVTTTACHPVMTFANGTVQSRRVEHLSAGSIIASPRSLPVTGKKTLLPEPIPVETSCSHDEHITIPKEITPALSRWLGLTIGDGYIHHARIEFVNADEGLVNEWITLSQQLFNFNPPYTRKKGLSTRIIYHTRTLPSYIAQLLNVPQGRAITSDTKHIPNDFFTTEQHCITALLSGLIDTDGYVSKTTPTLEYTSKNPVLADQVQHFLLRLGILSRKRTSEKCAVNTKEKIKREYTTITVEGKEKLERCTIIPITRTLKRERLYAWASKTTATNPNTDLLPQEANKLIHSLARTIMVNIKKLRKEYPRLGAYTENRCCPSREGLTLLLGVFEQRYDELRAILRQLPKEQLSLITAMNQARLPLQPASIAIGLSDQTIADHWATGNFHARPENLERLHEYVTDELSTRLERAEHLLTALHALATSDITWEEIINIEKIPGTPHVYDLCIADNHNFIANNIFVHNSNILDALCFVLGKSGSKSMRAEKSANLIYNGGKHGKPARQAEVSIFFDNTEKTFPLPEQEIKISRIVTQNGTSKYKINNQTRTRQELLDLLSKADINPDGYNIILQGDIVQLVEMSPIERRQIIEQIAGIGVYEERKQKALTELSNVEEKLGEADIILKERDTYLKELKKDRDHALKYKEAKDKLSSHKTAHLTIQKEKKDEHYNKFDEKRKKHHEKTTGIQEHITALRNEIKERKETLQQLNKTIEEQGDEHHKKLQKDLEHLKITIATTTTTISGHTSALLKAEERKHHLSKSKEQLDERLSQLLKEEAELSELVKHHEHAIKEVEEKLSIIKKKHNLEKEGTIITELDTLERELETVEERARTFRESQQQLLREQDKTEFQLSTLDTTIAKVKELEHQNAEELSNLKKLKEQFKKAVLELNELLNKDSKNAARLNQLRTEHSVLQEELGKLEAQRRATQETSANNIAVTKILENKQHLGDVFGTIAQLGTVDQKYALALDIAAGKHMNSIIVKDDATAARCIKYLKAEQLGIATFLPLNKLSPQQESALKEISKAKGAHGIASTLIEYEPAYKKAFEHVFGNTLIVDTIDTARRLGIGPVKMVTLDGDLAERGGVMTGGYRQKKRSGGFSDATLNKKIESLNEKLSEHSEELQSLQEQRSKDEEAITRLREFKATLEGDIIKKERSLHLGTSDLEATKEYKQQLEQELSTIRQKLSTLSNDITTINKTLAEKKTLRQKAKDSLSTLRNPLVLAELNAFEERRRAELEKKVLSASKREQLEHQKVHVLQPEQERTQQLLKDAEQEMVDMQRARKELEKTASQLKQELKEKEKDHERFQERFKDLFHQGTKLNEEINTNEGTISTLEQSSKQEEIAENTLSIELARINAERAGLIAELEQYSHISPTTGMSEEELKKEITSFERVLASIGNVNLKALDVYDTAEKEYAVLTEKKEVLAREKADVFNLMTEIEKEKKTLFLTAFNSVQEHFTRLFGQLSKKGQQAHLELENPETIFDEGMNIKVKLSGDKFLDLRSLSGGEKTLTALAFLFAVQEHDPATFYILDEVDAALDKHNSKAFADLIRSYCTKAQYLVISHNDAVITEADMLYGVSANEHGVSHVVSMKL